MFVMGHVLESLFWICVSFFDMFKRICAYESLSQGMRASRSNPSKRLGLRVFKHVLTCLFWCGT